MVQTPLQATIDQSNKLKLVCSQRSLPCNTMQPKKINICDELAAALGTHSLTFLICLIVIVDQDIIKGLIRKQNNVKFEAFSPAALSAALFPPIIIR